MSNIILVIIYNIKVLIILNVFGIFNLVWDLILDCIFVLMKKFLIVWYVVIKDVLVVIVWFL